MSFLVIIDLLQVITTDSELKFETFFNEYVTFLRSRNVIYNKTPLEKIINIYSAIHILSEICIPLNSFDSLNINLGIFCCILLSYIITFDA